MRTEKLEIVRYSAERKVLKRVVCLAGFISVFRSRNTNELKFYVDALNFDGVADLAEVLVDKRKAEPDDIAKLQPTITLEGLGRNDLAFLIDDIVSSANGEGSLIFNTLREETKHPFSSDPIKLSKNELAILKLLSLISRPGKVVVLEDPLADLPEELVEPVAKAMAHLVEKNRSLIVITKLFIRPECWIENEHVARVQIEAPRQRTIGFASSQYAPTGQFKMKDLEEIRMLGRSSSTFGVVNPADLPTETSVPNIRHLSKLAVFAGAATALIAVLLLNGSKPSSTKSRELVATSESAENNSGERGNSVGQSSSGSGSGFNASTANQPEGVKLALAEYPQEIQIAVTRAFTTPEEEIKQLPSFSPTPPRKAPVMAKNPLRESATSETPDAYAPSVSTNTDAPAESEEDITERRAKLRQSFLEALARARERLAAERGEAS